jgi:hypothetical protein
VIVSNGDLKAGKMIFEVNFTWIFKKNNPERF